MIRNLLRKKVVIVILAVLGFVITAVLFFGGNDTATQNTAANTNEEVMLRPDMTITVPLLFNPENANSIYDWGIVAGDTAGNERLVETNTFELFGQTYEFLLSTSKAQSEDEEYTVPEYLTLTITISDEAGTDEIVYIDLNADGGMDSVYFNDEELFEANVLEGAQTQYITELLLARDYMLDGMSF